MKLNLFIFNILFLSVFSAHANLTNAAPESWGGVLTELQAVYDVHAYDIAVKVNPTTKEISGFNTITFGVQRRTELIEIGLDPAFTIQDIYDLKTSRDLSYTRDGSKVFVKGNFSSRRMQKIKITYSGTPPVAVTPPWKGGFNWDKSKNGKPWVGVTMQSNGGKVFFPAKDHPSDKLNRVSMALTYPEGLVGVTNGVLESESTENGWTTRKWKLNLVANSYNLSINIGDFSEETFEYQGVRGPVPIALYLQKEDQKPTDGRSWEQKKQDLKTNLLNYLSYIEKHLGAYPWRSHKLGIVQTTYIGMEHQTQISYGANFPATDKFDELLFHELTHEWIGNLMTVRNWNHFWLQESPVGYLETRYLEDNAKSKEARDLRNTFKRNVKNIKPIVREEFNTALQMLADSDFYPRGILVAHSLGVYLGHKKFIRAIRKYIHSPQSSRLNQTDTPQFMDYLLSEFPDKPNLKKLLEVSLYQATPPKLVVTRADGVVKWKWSPEGFSFPLTYKSSQFETRMPDQTSGSFMLPDSDPLEWDPQFDLYYTLETNP